MARSEPSGVSGIPLLWEAWSHAVQGGPHVANDLLQTLWSGLGLNVLEVNRFLYEERPSFESFEQWISDVNGGEINAADLHRLRQALRGESVSSAIGDLGGIDALSEEDLAHWDERGYVILRNAVTPEEAAAAADAVYAHLNARADDPKSWYRNEQGHSIWVRTVRNAAFDANRRAPRVLKAFAQLWGREDLWPTIDQGGLNPPERSGWKFPGPNLHWDTSLAKPHALDVQGILYLTDTPAHQGAFTCIPGFHRMLDVWLDTLDPGEDPRTAILAHPGAEPIAAGAGDLILWNALLPHGSSPNRADRPRVVQYLSLRPTRWHSADVWR